MPRPLRMPPGVTEEDLRAAASEGRAAGHLSGPLMDYYLRVHNPEIYGPLEADRPSARARYSLYGRLDPDRKPETGSRVTRWLRRGRAEGVRQGHAQGVRQGARIGAEIEQSRLAKLAKWSRVEHRYDENTGPDPEASWVLGPPGVVARWGGVAAVVLSIGALLSKFDLILWWVPIFCASVSIGFCLWTWISFFERRAERDAKTVGRRVLPPVTGSVVGQVEYLRYDGRVEAVELVRPAETRMHRMRNGSGPPSSGAATSRDLMGAAAKKNQASSSIPRFDSFFQ